MLHTSPQDPSLLWPKHRQDFGGECWPQGNMGRRLPSVKEQLAGDDLPDLKSGAGQIPWQPAEPWVGPGQMLRWLE